MRENSHVTVLVELRRAEAQLPHRATALSSGWDLHAAEPATIPPGGRALVSTGLAVALPPGYEMQIRPRSGLALKHGVTVLNAPGTVDADYRGEVGIILINHGREDFEVRVGDRIAQAVVMQHASVSFDVAAALPPTARGDGGFGHTGQR